MLSAPLTPKPDHSAALRGSDAKLARYKMISNDTTRPEIEDALITCRSGVWIHFGFTVNYEDDGEKQWWIKTH